MKKLLIISVVLLLYACRTLPVFGAVGCTLNNPDEDIKQLFPRSTSYKTDFIPIDQHGGRVVYNRIQQLLGDTFDTIYETIDVPYAYYRVYRGSAQVGYVHGVNQKSRYGGMQIILATDLDGRIITWYYQKLSSPDAALLKSEAFRKQFIGLTLADFYKHDYFKTDKQYAEKDRVGKITDPTKDSHQDFLSTIRGMRKNLILLDHFWLNKKYEPYWSKSQEMLKK